ncbi:YchF family ATPase [Oceanotoga sp. DSM 15011]|jgi:hypothetical protein|uniref:YchF family ATPase n=1 Tax=Oceanotoga sp. DSM 15011 TaxID=2984951 RepID=UPI0021F48B5E|nr:YchF family ATPase [Oceanotoga sp. DSM 15011]UYP00306.1 YchF family ATPase [Oceanotoga sp. DSM 15011]
MKIGIFGLPMSGKTTIFSLLTDTPYDGSYKVNSEEKRAFIRDERIEKLSEIYQPKKTTYAELDFVDIPSFDSSSDQKEKSRILQMIQNVDSMILVIRAFENDEVPYPDNNETPLKQLNTLIAELIIRDIEVVENRLARLEISIKKNKASKDEIKENEILEGIKNLLMEEKFASNYELNEEEKKLISSLSLFTLKPIITVVNIDENQHDSDDYSQKEELISTCKDNNFAYIDISGKIESDLVELDEDERKMFMEELNIERPGISRLSKVVYDHIGLISYFTVGKDEVRAWTIKKGTNMKKAAGAIHSALEKGFIKAEVIKYEDLIVAGNDEEARKQGLSRLAGKDEIVEDGNIMEIRANS